MLTSFSLSELILISAGYLLVLGVGASALLLMKNNPKH